MRAQFARAAGRQLRKANYWLIAQAAKAAISILRLLPMDAALNFADRTARRLGPLFGRHRVALDNLRKAFPEKSEAEIRAIALDMWGNMARLGAEYIYLDLLFDYDAARPNVGRIEARGTDIYERLAAEKKAHTFFGRPCETSPLLPKLARQFDCDVYPARSRRLPGNRFLLEIEEKLPLPR